MLFTFDKKHRSMQIQHSPLFQQQAFVNGLFVPAQSGKDFPVYNPYDGSLLAKVADLGAADTHQAIQAASNAFQEWRLWTGTERAQVLRRWYELQIQHQEDLAQILTLEQGKPLAEARGEVRYGASFVEWFAAEAQRNYGDTIPGHQRDKRILVIRQAIGVVAAITPWNFPNAMITRKVAPALAAGCTVLLKPATQTPLSALALAVLANEAGIPPGVLNILPCQDPVPVGLVLSQHPKIRKLSFTGSTRVGKLLLAQCASTVKRVSMELGGNAPFIIFDDANLENAIAGAIQSKYRNAGQTCVCANRIFVQKGIYPAFLEGFKKAVESLNLGNGMDPKVVVGPMIEEKALRFVEDLIEDAHHKGGQILCGGKRANNESKSLLFEPTIIGNAHQGMKLFSEEIFGPVAPIFPFTDEEEVIRLANDTSYGLAAYFYSQNQARIWKVSEALEYGMIGINTGMISTTLAPFGGIKESGLGREGSKYGMHEYTEQKYMCMDIAPD